MFRFQEIPDRPAEEWAPRLILLLGFAVGLCWLGYYYSAGLTTAHYDAKARLLMARKLFDSTSPGYLQMGTHWLPLLHILYLPFVVVDSQYRTGFTPSLISVASYALSGWLLYRIARRATGSWRAGVFSGVLFLSNANWQYLQSSPLTEPVFAVLMLLAVDRLLAWRENAESALPWSAAIWTALCCMCRYEGWLVFGGVLSYLLFERWRGALDSRTAARAMFIFVIAFSLPVAAHFGYLYAWTGESFFHRVARGNASPYVTYRRPLLSLIYHLAELAQIAASVPLVMAIGGIAYSLRSRERAIRWLPLFLLWLPSVMNVAALYWGLIYRVRYSTLLVPAIAVFAGLLTLSGTTVRHTFTACVLVVAALPWASHILPHSWEFRALFAGPGIVLLPLTALGLFLYASARNRYVLASLALCVAGTQIPVLKGEYRPILAEALEHSYIEPERQQVLTCLRENYDGSRILIDIGRLAPLVYDTGFPVREFVYNEGEQKEWARALSDPASEVGWICMEKGDELWNLGQVDPHWLYMYSLAVQTQNFRLYRFRYRNPEPPVPDRRLE